MVQLSSRYHSRVPTDVVDNLKYRRRLNRACELEPDYRNKVWQACSADPIFFFNSFCWCIEPRPRVVGGRKLPVKIPFIAWEHQVDPILTIAEHLGFRDVGVEKSRAEGASWIGILLATWDWTFHSMTSIGLVSKDQDAADTPDDPDSLMGKIDWELLQLPYWMVGEKDIDFRRNRSDHLLKNLRNGSVITAFAATADVASGGRRKWFLIDELAKFPRGPDKEAMASTQHVTDCRLVVSTPKGSSGAYAEAMNNDDTNMVKVILDWKSNPTKNRGMYRLEKGRPVAVDVERYGELPPEYKSFGRDIQLLLEGLRRRGYDIDEKTEDGVGKLRAPWYDNECIRFGASPQNIAQELDRDYGGSEYRYFRSKFMGIVHKTVCPPLHEGNMDWDIETMEPTFELGESGPIKLWLPLDASLNPPAHRYVVGCDISYGLGGTFTSNSTITAMDQVTKEQVLAFASRSTNPEELADLAIAVSKWLNNAYLIWEANGPGMQFTIRVLKQGYGNIYYRASLSDKGTKKRKKPGWWSTADTKSEIFSEFKQAVMGGKDAGFVVKDQKLADEFQYYVLKDGKITHGLLGDASEDSKGASHGDRVISACVCNIGSIDIPFTDAQEVIEAARPGTFAFRQAAYERQHNQDLDGDAWVE